MLLNNFLLETSNLYGQADMSDLLDLLEGTHVDNSLLHVVGGSRKHVQPNGELIELG